MGWGIFIAGLTVGVAGSLHCVGMCGPLSMALPTHHLPPVNRFFSLLAYQAGRVITYSLIGLLFGWAGHGIYLAGYQQWFSIGMGILVLSMAIVYFLKRQFRNPRLLDIVYQPVQRLLLHLLRTGRGMGGFLLTGMANGLLPCGMVYVALAATFSFTHARESMMFMAAFGMGTLPAMLGVAYAGSFLSAANRLSLRRAVPYVITGMGVLLILRGMNLGIPFVSPVLPAAPGQAVVCHP